MHPTQDSPFAGAKPELVKPAPVVKPVAPPKPRRDYFALAKATGQLTEQEREAVEKAQQEILGIEYYDWLSG